MNKQVAKSLLAIGLSFSIINCGGVETPSLESEAFDAQEIAIQHFDVNGKIDAKSVVDEPEVNVVLMPSVDRLPETDLGDSKTMRTHVVVADSVRPIAIKAERLGEANSEVKYQLLETPDLKPAVDLELDSDAPLDLVVDLPDFADGMLSVSELEPLVDALGFDDSVETVAPERFWSQALAVEGIYELNRHGMSLDVCDSTDAAELEGLEDFAVLKALKMDDGTPYLLVVSADSPEDAEIKVEQMMAGRAYRTDFSFIATDLGRDGFFRGQSGVAGNPTEEGTCESGSVTETIVGVVDGALKLEARLKKVNNIEQNSVGQCAIEDTLDASSSMDCSSLELLTGDLVEAL